MRAGPIQTDLGEVIDLSEGGVRIKRRRGLVGPEVGGTLMLALRGPTQSVTCPCRVVWLKKTWLSAQIGLEFLDQSEMFQRSLRQLSGQTGDLLTPADGSQDTMREAA